MRKSFQPYLLLRGSEATAAIYVLHMLRLPRCAVAQLAEAKCVVGFMEVSHA